MRLFGTDGIRELAGTGWLAPERLPALGAAIGAWLSRCNRRGREGPPSLLLASDGRESAEQIKEGLRRGWRKWEVSAIDAGLCPTPVGAFLVRQRGLDAGIIISASHNPASYNGIKIISPEGEKLSDEEEDAIEQLIPEASPPLTGKVPPLPKQEEEGYESYQTAVKRHLGPEPFLSGRQLFLDTACGATYRIAPRLFQSFGADITTCGDRPNGRNINRQCGTTYPSHLIGHVRRGQPWLGIAFDGDGDRVLLCDPSGTPADGHPLLAYLATRFKQSGHLDPPCVVSTVMANLGLERYLEHLGIALYRTPVGDKYVYRAMKDHGLRLGGEPSGHVVIRDGFATTGDGIYTALVVTKLLVETGDAPSSAFATCPLYPQQTVAIHVRERVPLDQCPEIIAAEAAARAALGEQGRVIIRYSGTEPVLRIMVEAEREPRLREVMTMLAAACRRGLGAKADH